MGRKDVSARLLTFLFEYGDIEIVGVLTDHHLPASPVAKVATELGVPIYDYDEASELIERGKLAFDLGISVLYWKKLKGQFISAPSKGIINFHPAPLPEYRGTGGYNLAILESRSSWSVTAHYVDENIDTGRIVESTSFDIDQGSETVISLERRSLIEIESLAKRIIIKAANEDSCLPSIKNLGGRYVSRVQMEAMKEIVPGDDIDRKIRAFWFPPYDGAYIEIDQKKYTLVNREILESLAPPGTTSLFTKS